ncbi:MAG: T9SS type A sorting domain-containing protein, partial [Flavobacteriaceae bacterium]|nr:T9SS type A sorting domain-containing protein [Flavobacteriaceae bacterium]
TAAGAAVLTFAATSTANYTVQLTAASNLTFKDLTLANTTVSGQTVGGIVEYGGSTSNIQFINNTFNGNAGTATSNAWGAIRFGSVPTTGNGIGVWKFIGNRFNNISYGVNINGTTLINADSVIVQNNTINCSYYHVATYYVKNVVATNNTMNTTSGGIGYNYVWYPSTSVVFSNNTMSGMIYGFASFVTSNSIPALSYTINNNTITSAPAAATNYGIYISGSTTAANAISRVTIKNNNIALNGSSSSWGILAAYVNSTVASPSEISNNMIAIVAPATATTYGIYPNHVANMNIDHNTVSVLGGSATFGRGLYINRSTSTTAFVVGALNVRNNIISNTGLGYAVEIAATANTAAMIGAMSNNAYQGNALNPFRAGTVATNYTTLATWQAATTKDAGSVFGTINFYGPTDLHVQNALANNIGTPLASITTDIDGQSRSATTPDAGADEYTPLSCVSAAAITVPTFGGNTATVSWTTTNTPVSYKVRHRTIGTGAWTVGTQTAATKNLTGLQSFTTYEVQVKEFCSTTDSSIWSGSTAFTTAIIPNWIENFQVAVPPVAWTRAAGRLLNPTVFSGGSTSWAQDDYGNLVPNGPNGKSARVNIWSTAHFNWLISPSIAIPNNALSYQIEYDLALTAYAATTASTMGVDDTLALVVSLDNGLTWNLSNTVMAYNAASTITPAGSHVIIPIPTSWKGNTIKLGWYSQSTISNADNDVFIDNFEVKDNATCPITAVPTVPAVTTCGPQAVTLSATWANSANQHIWLSPTGVIKGRGNAFTTPVLTASTTQDSRLIGRDNSVNAVSGGPQITLTNPAGSGGNFSNGMWFTATQPFMLDSATVKAYATAAGGTIRFQVRISEKAGTHAASTGAQLYLSDTITVTTTSTTGELKRIPINIPVLTGSYYVNLNFVAGTTGTLFRSTALPTGTTYPYALGGLGSLDSVQLGTTGTNARIYYLFNWKMSAVCLGPIVTTNVTYASVPSVTLPHVSGFATGAPCNWVASAAPGATWQGKTSYTGNGYTATTLNGTPFVMVDDDGAGSSAVTPNSVLTTPSFPALGYDTLRMKFLSVFKGGTWGGKGYLDVWRPVNGVFGWQTIDSLSADEGIGATATGWAAASKSYNVTAYQSNQFKARFRYNDKGLWAGWWAIDQFELNGTLSPTGNVRVAVTTDIYGSEVSWKIVNTSNKLVYASGGPFPDVTPYVAATATHIDTVQIPLVGNFEFRLTDSYGDGLFDGTNNGTYIVQKLCAWGNSIIDTGSGANDYDPGGSTANVASWDSAVFNMDCSQPATYHVSVNMNQQTVSTNGVHIAGNFQGWNPATTAMTDANGDGIYEYTINTFLGRKIEYKFINGNAWGSDESVPVACRVPGTLNRGDSIANLADSAATVCYALCFNCAGVTFNVDMNQVAQAFTTPEVNGLWNNWCGNCNPLTDANGDGIWTTTLPLPVGTTQEYKFSADNWTIQEQNNPAAPCTNGNATYTNRVLVIPATDTVLSVVCWSSCFGCDVDVTLKVNMAWEVANNAISANGVHVAGDFQGWSPSTTPMTDANNDGIYEVTFTVPANSSIQYKFINGNAWGADESVPSACVVPTTMNRGATFAYGDSTMSPVCFGKCTDCAAGLGESLQNVSLFPNPTRGQFNLARMDAATEVEVSVLDLQGKVLTVAKWSEGVDTLSIDLSNFANGVYMVRMTSEEGSRTMRVSVQK